MDLSQKVIVITGANAQLASDVISALYQEDARLVLSSRNLEKLDAWIAKCGFESDRVLTAKTDVTNIDDVKDLMKKGVERFGRLDVLITFAGVQVRKPAIDMSVEEWRYVLDVNLTGTFFAAQSAAEYMRNQGKGKIIFVSSLTAEIGLPNMAAYVASRGGIKQLAKGLAVEWAGEGITVNCIGPGRFHTKMTDDIFSNEQTRKSFLACIPMGRPGVPSDLVGISLFLCSDTSDYFTGQSFYPDGGWLASGGSAIS